MQQQLKCKLRQIGNWWKIPSALLASIFRIKNILIKIKCTKIFFTTTQKLEQTNRDKKESSSSTTINKFNFCLIEKKQHEQHQ